MLLANFVLPYFNDNKLLNIPSKFQNIILDILCWSMVTHFNVVFPLLIKTFELCTLAFGSCHYKCICKFMQDEHVSCLKTLVSPFCCDTLWVFYELWTSLLKLLCLLIAFTKASTNQKDKHYFFFTIVSSQT